MLLEYHIWYNGMLVEYFMKSKSKTYTKPTIMIPLENYKYYAPITLKYTKY